MTSSGDWKVLEHGPLVQAADNLWYVVGSVPDMPLERRMVVARLDSGGLVVHGAIAMSEEAMAELDRLGPVEAIVVPNGWHRLDAPRYHRRYPSARVLCPPGARKKVAKVVAVDGSYDQFPAGASVSLEVVDGLGGAEGVMIVKAPDGTTLVFNDLLFNVPHGRGFQWAVLRIIGSTGGPKVTRVMRLFAVKDKKQVRAHLERLAQIPDLVRLIPGHGHIIEREPARALRSVAAAL